MEKSGYKGGLQRINVMVDRNDYTYLIAMNYNVSMLIRELISNYIDNKKKKVPKDKIKVELKQKEKELETIHNDISVLKTMITKLEEEEDKIREKEEEEGARLYDGLRASGILAELGK